MDIFCSEFVVKLFMLFPRPIISVVINHEAEEKVAPFCARAVHLQTRDRNTFGCFISRQYTPKFKKVHSPKRL